MRVNRGCGCLVLVLMAVDLVFTVMYLVVAFTDVGSGATTTDKSVTAPLFFSLLFACNAVVCGLFSLRSLRPGAGGVDAPPEDWTGDEPED